MKAEILQRLRQQAAGAALTTADMPKDASDVDLMRQYLDDIESRLVCNNRGNYSPCLQKLCKLIFWQNLVKFRPIVKIFGTKIARRTSFSEVYLFSTSPDLCQRTTVWNTDVPNSYITL